MAPQSKGGKKPLKRQFSIEHYKGWFPKTQKNSLYVALLLLEFQDNL
jgi:hypothetical protein